MKRKLAIFLILTMVMSLVQIPVFALSASKVVILYNNDDAMVGAGWSTNGSGDIIVVAHPLAENGNTVQISSVKKTLYHSRAIAQAYYGSMEIYFDMYQTATDYETNLQLRRFNLAGGSQVFDKKLVQLTNGGTIKVDGANTGWCYKANQNYKFKLVIDSVKQTYSTYLVSGLVSTTNSGEGTLKENLLLASGNLDATFAAISAIQFNGTQTGATSYSYIDNIKMIALPVTISVQEVSNGIVASDVTKFNIDMNQFIDTAYASGFSVIKNGIAMAASDYTISYGATITGTVPVFAYAKNMVVTMNEAFEDGDNVKFSFGSMRDTFGRTLEDQTISFKVGDLTSVDPTIKGIAGYEDLIINHSDNTISTIVGGYPSQPIFDNIQLAHVSATKQLLDSDENDVTSTKTALYGGDKVKITAADGISTKTYTFVEKTAIFAYDFNNANSTESARVHSGNRSQTAYNTLYPASQSWGNIYIAGSGAGVDAYATADYAGLKTDLSAQLVMKDLVNSGSNAIANAIWKDIAITQGNNYVLSADIKAADLNSNVYVSWRAGKYNTGKFLPAPFFISAGGEITIFDTNMGTAVPNSWYHVQAMIDTAQSILKVYVNGKYIAQTTIPADTLTSWVDSGFFSVQLGQSAPGKTTTTSTAYFDNFSVKEIYSIDVLPSADTYQLESSLYEMNHNEGKIYCAQGTTAEDILASLSGYPDSYTMSIYNSDESGTVSGAIDLSSNAKLIILNGENVISYGIVAPETEKLKINGEKAYYLGLGTNTFYMQRDSGTMVAALYDISNGRMLKEVKLVDLAVENEVSFEITDTAAKTMLKVIVLDTINNLIPKENAKTILGK